MNKLYSYVLRIDDGAAPNPFWGCCTLSICKPAIRRVACVGDWIVGTGSAKSRISEHETKDFSMTLVYAMRVTCKMSLQRYDHFCQEQLHQKIPQWNANDWRLRLGDSIYQYLGGKLPVVRKSVHSEKNREKDLSGKYALLSRHFYYFGKEPVLIPENLKTIIKKNQGHKVQNQSEILERFESWISQFELNKLYAEPQLAFEFKKTPSNDFLAACARDAEESDC